MDTAYVLFEGPKGWLGYEVASPGSSLPGAVKKCNDYLQSQPTQSTMEIVDGKDHGLPAEDGEWIQCSGKDLVDAIYAYVDDGDEEALTMPWVGY